MKETIEWLLEIEAKAFEVYSKAAVHFSGDKDFADFVIALSAEEKEHNAVIRRAAELVAEHGGFTPFTFIGKELQDNLMERFLWVEKAIEEKTLTKEKFVECIVYTEFSEWNDLFKYVVNALTRRFRDFVPLAVEIERHRKGIERFLARRPEFKASLEAIKSLPPLWTEKILVVDDEETITDLFSVFLSDEGSVDCVRNGREALERLERNYYAAIISDIDMPEMDGIEFFKRAEQMYPGIERRFLFFSGRLPPETASFLEENNIRYFGKPSSIKEIKKAVIDMLS